MEVVCVCVCVWSTLVVNCFLPSHGVAAPTGRTENLDKAWNSEKSGKGWRKEKVGWTSLDFYCHGKFVLLNFYQYYQCNFFSDWFQLWIQCVIPIKYVLLRFVQCNTVLYCTVLYISMPEICREQFVLFWKWQPSCGSMCVVFCRSLLIDIRFDSLFTSDRMSIFFWM